MFLGSISGFYTYTLYRNIIPTKNETRVTILKKKQYIVVTVTKEKRLFQKSINPLIFLTFADICIR